MSWQVILALGLAVVVSGWTLWDCFKVTEDTDKRVED